MRPWQPLVGDVYIAGHLGHSKHCPSSNVDDTVHSRYSLITNGDCSCRGLLTQRAQVLPFVADDCGPGATVNP